MHPGISYNQAYSSLYSIPSSDWTFINGRNFGNRNSNQFYINATNNTTIIRNSIFINNPRTDRARNVTYSAGPYRSDVESHSGKSIPSYAIKENQQHNQNISNGQMQIYRPNIRPASNGVKPAPAKVRSATEVRAKEEKRTEKQLSPQRQEQPQPQQKQNQPQRQEQPQPQQKQNQPQRQEQPQPQQKQNQPQRQEQPKQQPPQKQNQPPHKQEQPKQPPVQKQNTPPQKTRENNARKDSSLLLIPELINNLN
jgi:hypothetical protein